ncbi:MAG: PAS domain-containing protein [Hydrogenibacillus sp.]|nr:PAS domain-containing protein [Hydrogenibacillus sp.]
MKSLRLRLTVGVLGIVAVSFVAFFLYEAVLTARTVEQEARRHLFRESALIADALTALYAGAASASGADAVRAMLVRFARSTGERYVVLSGDGRILADVVSSADPELRRVDPAPAPDGVITVTAAEEGSRYAQVSRSVRFADGSAGTVVVIAALSRRTDLITGAWGLGGLFGGLAVLGLLSLLIFHVAKELTRPLVRVAEVARQISRQHYGVTVDVQGYGELAELTEAINAMSASLAQQVKRIRDNEKRLSDILTNMTSGVVLLDPRGRVLFANRAALALFSLGGRAITGRHHVEAFRLFELSQLVELVRESKAAARRELIVYFPEERVLDVHLVPLFDDAPRLDAILLVAHDITDIRRLERIRSEFVANASHELKTPVTSIQGFAETLLDGALDEAEEARRFVEIIYHESERLKRLIQDILDLSRIEGRRLPLDYRDVHIQSLFEDILLQVEKERSRKSMVLTAEVDPRLHIESDYDRLKQILLNLVVNAVQYTPEGGRIALRAEDEGEDVVFVVQDNGIGIPKRDLDRIFERFYRVDKARSRNSGGTGLGLSIVRHLVELLGGEIRVESTEGVGSTFYVRLPKARDEAL